MLKGFFDKFKNKENSEEIEEIKEDNTSLESLEENIEEEISDNIEELKENIVENEVEEEVQEEKIGFFDRLKKGLTKTRDSISSKIDLVLASYQKVDEELFEDLEDTLISADLGVESTMQIIDELTERVKLNRIKNPLEVKTELSNIMKEKLKNSVESNVLDIQKTPKLILVVGVNGVGKTTTIGKMASKFKNQGKKVMLVAADTFRAAAIEQLTEWANRAKVDIISHNEGADPASVIFDGISSAKSKKVDILICDTAGRLHNKKNLMNELNKIHRVIEREYPEAEKETLLVVDGTTGQNAIFQAKEFKEAANLTGVVITKLDGTAKGGVIFPLQVELGLPIKLIGVGEQIDNLMEFDSDDFVDAIIN
ncbi:signal recognition particle-docking protein FtsY [Miniphocaeibacter massiliensis]|uniref:signal recognition particle-docking protein FtsY n=1 Tax=Miniphocaeibacter massiliensis TaxID=2041841 RepID=UPI000C06C132|nr:signal recognition particle-docking protein FtsY [Miniphocaeibacter massiliensis]